MKLLFSEGVASVRIKLALLTVGIFIAIGTLYYTQRIVKRLEMRETKIAELYAKSLEYISSSKASDNDFTFIFENVVKRIDFPLILTDANDNVNFYDSSGGIKNLDFDRSLSKEKLTIFFNNKLKEFADEHPPIEVSYADSIVLGKIYYGSSDLVKSLQYYPYLQIFFAVVFILISYIGFSYIKRNEQSNIWVGMAKETAHQLGTPISSLMGWSELLKMSYQDGDKVLDVAEEMNSDLTRLNKIASRFSKIGSKPELKPTPIVSSIKKVSQYFSKRLPYFGKNVELKIEGDASIQAMLNIELFEWVIENLIKNALDAIGNETGKISFSIKKEKEYIQIDVEDTGKGFDMKNRKDIFRPGFSTKKRGWGLGLSLSKRIIKDYHKGKIFVKNSVPGEGTIFRIILRAV